MADKELNFEKDLAPVVAEVATVKEVAEALVIKDEKTNEKAIELVGNLTAKKKQIEEMRKFFVDPLNAQVKAINAKFKPEALHTEEVITIVKGKMADYHKAEEEKVAKEEARKQAIRDKANAKRAEEGKEEIAEPVKPVQEVAQTKSAGGAKTTVKKVWKHKIVSIDALPEDVKKAIFAEAYKKGLIDTVIRKFVNAGIREMSGVDIYQDSEVSVKV